MKRFLYLVLCFVLLCSFAGCGNSAKEDVDYAVEFLEELKSALEDVEGSCGSEEADDLEVTASEESVEKSSFSLTVEFDGKSCDLFTVDNPEDAFKTLGLYEKDDCWVNREFFYEIDTEVVTYGNKYMELVYYNVGENEYALGGVYIYNCEGEAPEILRMHVDMALGELKDLFGKPTQYEGIEDTYFWSTIVDGVDWSVGYGYREDGSTYYYSASMPESYFLDGAEQARAMNIVHSVVFPE